MKQNRSLRRRQPNRAGTDEHGRGDVGAADPSVRSQHACAQPRVKTCNALARHQPPQRDLERPAYGDDERQRDMHHDERVANDVPSRQRMDQRFVPFCEVADRRRRPIVDEDIGREEQLANDRRYEPNDSGAVEYILRRRRLPNPNRCVHPQRFLLRRYESSRLAQCKTSQDGHHQIRIVPGLQATRQRLSWIS